MNEQQISKGEQWYFHPNESIRMLRYFQFNMKFDTSIDYTPHYSNDPSVGVVIGTVGEVPYIDMQLHYLVNVNGIKKVLVCDDCSDKQTELKMLCDFYGVDFYSSSKKVYYNEFIGGLRETNTLYIGLQWAKSNNLEILVKLNADLIPCKEWVTELKQLACNTDASIFGLYNVDMPYNLQSNCVAMNVDIWIKNYPLQCLQFQLENELTVLFDCWLYELAKTLSGNNYSEKWLSYIKESKHGYLKSGYAHWHTILKDMHKPDLLCKSTCKLNDYLLQSEKIFGNKYSMNDF